MTVHTVINRHDPSKKEGERTGKSGDFKKCLLFQGIYIIILAIKLLAIKHTV